MRPRRKAIDRAKTRRHGAATSRTSVTETRNWRRGAGRSCYFDCRCVVAVPGLEFPHAAVPSADILPGVPSYNA